MKNIYLGETIDEERLEIDFEKENIRFILLVGRTGSGKSVFHFHLYGELMRAYTLDELGFVFLDMTRVDFSDWKESAYLDQPIVQDPEKAIQVLEDIGKIETDRKIIIHIEECDMVCLDRPRMEAAFDQIKTKKNILVVYSTSRIDPEYLTDWMNRYVDMRIVCAVMTAEDSRLLLGNDVATHFVSPGEKIIAYNDKQIHCKPLVVTE